MHRMTHVDTGLWKGRFNKDNPDRGRSQIITGRHQPMGTTSWVFGDDDRVAPASFVNNRSSQDELATLIEILERIQHAEYIFEHSILVIDGQVVLFQVEGHYELPSEILYNPHRAWSSYLAM